MQNFVILLPLILSSVAPLAGADHVLFEDVVETAHEVADPAPEPIPVPESPSLLDTTLPEATLEKQEALSITLAARRTLVARKAATSRTTTTTRKSTTKKTSATKTSTKKKPSIQAAVKKTTTTKKKTTTKITTQAAAKKKTTTKKKKTSTKKSSPQPTAPTGSGKRGLAYNDASLTAPWGANQDSSSQVSWTYNWYSYACGWASWACGYNTNLEYIPMLWSNASDLTSVWPTAAQFAIDNGSTALFSFNEPDLCIEGAGSSCMTVPSAVKAYKKYMQPFAGKAKLGAPAVTNAGAPYGLAWLSKFMDACDGCTFDFINVHWYSNIYAGASYFESYINSVRQVSGGKPIWVTEFGITNDEPCTQAQLTHFLETVMAWMDQQDDIHRYSYFMNSKGILMNSAGSDLSALGSAYNTYSNSTKQPYVG